MPVMRRYGRVLVPNYRRAAAFRKQAWADSKISGGFTRGFQGFGRVRHLYPSGPESRTKCEHLTNNSRREKRTIILISRRLSVSTLNGDRVTIDGENDRSRKVHDIGRRRSRIV